VSALQSALAEIETKACSREAMVETGIVTKKIHVVGIEHIIMN
jgi:hypothetical protein